MFSRSPRPTPSIPMGNGGPLPPEVLDRLIPGLKNHPTTLIFLAYKNQQAVGSATCFRGFSTFAARPLINIHDLVVLPDIAEWESDAACWPPSSKKHAKLGCCKVTLEVQENNTKARRTYEQAGFTQGVYGPNHRRLAVLLEDAVSSPNHPSSKTIGYIRADYTKYVTRRVSKGISSLTLRANGLHQNENRSKDEDEPRSVVVGENHTDKRRPVFKQKVRIMAKQAGVWIDHKQAIVVLLTGKEKEIKKIAFDIGQPIRAVAGSRSTRPYKPGEFIAEDTLQRKVENDRQNYYDDVLKSIRGAKGLLVTRSWRSQRRVRQTVPQQKAQRGHGRRRNSRQDDRSSDRSEGRVTLYPS